MLEYELTQKRDSPILAGESVIGANRTRYYTHMFSANLKRVLSTAIAEVCRSAGISGATFYIRGRTTAVCCRLR
jgi:hypothetical protein